MTGISCWTDDETDIKPEKTRGRKPKHHAVYPIIREAEFEARSAGGEVEKRGWWGWL
jgi:hypothetical protein